MVLQNIIRSRKGSTLIWVMVALLVISMLTALVLTISSRFFTSTKERSLDSQAYHSAYSMSRSIAAWIQSYDPTITAGSPGFNEEEEKRKFIDALIEASEDDASVIIDASDAQSSTGQQGQQDLASNMGTVKAELTYNRINADVAQIKILSTSEFAGRESSVEAILESSLTRTNVSKNVTFQGDFDPKDFGLTVNVVDEINNAVHTWPAMAKNPAFMGKYSGSWRYYTVTVDSYDMSNPEKPAYISVNPRVAGGNGGDTRINRLLYYSNPVAGDRIGTSTSFNRNDFAPDGSIVHLENIPTTPVPGKGNTKYIDLLDMRVLLDPEKSMLDNDLLESKLFSLKGSTGASDFNARMPVNNFFGGSASTPGTDRLLTWPTTEKAATCLLVTGVGVNGTVPGTRFTYFTDKDFNNPALDTNYIIPRYLGGGNTFATTASGTPWSTYKSLYLYLLNESDKYLQITGAVESQGGAVYTKRDFMIGGSFDETGASNGTEIPDWAHIGNYPTMISDMQLYFASPENGKLESVIQGTPGVRVKNNATSIPEDKIKYKTRVNGGWIVIHDSHKLTITNALVNTQKMASKTQSTIAVVDVNDMSNGTSSAKVSSSNNTFSTELFLDAGHNEVESRRSGNDIYVSRGGELVIGRGALICSDIYVDEGAELTFEDDAVLYGNIYSKGTININSSNVRIYGKASIDVSFLGPNIPTDGILAGGIFNYEGGQMSTTVPAAALNAVFPNNVGPKEKLMGIHSYEELTDAKLKEFVETYDQVDSKGVCTHFDMISGANNWHVISFDDF